MRAGDAFDVFVAIAGEADLHFVLGVDGEGVAERFAAAGAEGKAVEVLLLGEIGREIEGFAAGSAGGNADGEAADFAGGGEVAFEQRGREVADGDVVEAVAGFVGGKQGGDVDIDGEEVADGVAGTRCDSGGGRCRCGRDRACRASSVVSSDWTTLCIAGFIRAWQMPAGGMVRPRRRRKTFSQPSGCSAGVAAESRARLAAFDLLLWQPAQYVLTRRRSGDCACTQTANPRATQGPEPVTAHTLALYMNGDGGLPGKCENGIEYC